MDTLIAGEGGRYRSRGGNAALRVIEHPVMSIFGNGAEGGSANTSTDEDDVFVLTDMLGWRAVRAADVNVNVVIVSVGTLDELVELFCPIAVDLDVKEHFILVRG